MSRSRSIGTAALAMIGALLAACSSPDAATPVVVTPTTTALSLSAATSAAPPSTSFMTLPRTSTPAPAPTAPSPTPTPTSAPNAAAPGTTETSAEIVRPGPGTVVYHGTTFVMPPEETTKLAESATVTIDSPPDLGSSAAAAARAYEKAIKLTNSAYRKPTKSWVSKASEVMADPYMERFLEGVDKLQSAGLHAVGNIATHGVVIEVNGNRAEIDACFDTGQTRIVDTTGNSMTASGSDRYRSRAKLEILDSKWKLVDATDYRDRPC